MGISGEVALGAAKSYTDETVIGGGALKGKNCTISSITEITGGHRVTFKWTLDDGTEKTQSMDVMDGQGGGTSDYSALSNKPSINSVTLSGNKTTSDLGISYNDLSNKPTIPSVANCYETTDTASDAIDDSDKIPFYNVSVSSKRNMTLSNLKSKLKTYFDNIYSTITTIGALSDVNISSASNGQVLKYDSSTSKWVNANESGGGGGGSAIDYSTVEQDTGIKWVDGKTIYQKTLDFGTITLATTKSESIGDVSIDRLISAVGFGELYFGSEFKGRITFPSYGIGNFNQKITVKTNSTDTEIAVYSEKASGTGTQTVDNAYVTIQYTKTTT